MTVIHRTARAPWAVRDDLARMLVDAYLDLPLAAWLVPDPDLRVTLLTRYAAIRLEHGYFHGEVEVLADRSGVAVWLHHGRRLTLPQSYHLRHDRDCHPYAERFAEVEAVLAAALPEQPHRQLDLLAVLPERRGAGRAGELPARRV
jgi:hypothetical protein